MGNINYEEMEKMYREVSESNSKPDLVYGNMTSLRAIFGEEEVDAMILRGDIRVSKIDDDLEVLYARNSNI